MIFRYSRVMKCLFFFLISFVFVSFSCNKEKASDYYFLCTINGEKYLPNSCANCLVVKLLGDTTIIVNANKGFESIGIGVVKTDKKPIAAVTYLLNDNKQQKGSYDNSPLVDDIFITNDLHTGQLTINELDKVRKNIAGNFSFQAYNDKQGESVYVKGKFRLLYKTN